MAERKKLEIPKRFKDKYGDRFMIWSYSRLGTYHNCLYEYYLARIRKEKGEDNIYSMCGSYSHDILEDFYNGNVKYEDMAKRFEENFLEVEISDYKFSSDEDKNRTMTNKYKSCITHFFKNHRIVNSKVLSEREVWVDVNGNIFIGYIDATHKENDMYIVTDYKTSSISEFQGAKLKEKQKQLLLYALGLHQLGIPLDKLAIRWNFLKYTNIVIDHMINVTYREKEGTKTSCVPKNGWVNKVKTQLKKDIQDIYPKKNQKEIKSILNTCIEDNSLKCLPVDIQRKYTLSKVVKTGERHRWVKEITTQLRKDLKNNGFEDIEIETLIIDCINNNSLDAIKNYSISKNYILEDCYIYGDVSQETIDDLIKNMCEDIEQINKKGKDEDSWAIDGIPKNKEYYCNVLCGYKKHCKYHREYIKNLKEQNQPFSSNKVDIDLLSELENL